MSGNGMSACGNGEWMSRLAVEAAGFYSGKRQRTFLTGESEAMAPVTNGSYVAMVKNIYAGEDEWPHDWRRAKAPTNGKGVSKALMAVGKWGRALMTVTVSGSCLD